MNFETIKAWLTRQTNNQIRIRWMLAFLGIILTPFAIAAGSLVISVIVFAFTRSPEHPEPTAKCFWIGLSVIPVLFIINRFMPRNEKENYYEHDEPDGSLVGGYVYRRKVQLRVFLWILFTGPRLVDWVIFSFRRIAQLKKQDTHSCAALLWLLMVKGKRVPYPDIQREVDWLDIEATAPQLNWISGALSFPGPPQAMTLTEDLRAEIRSGAGAG